MNIVQKILQHFHRGESPIQNYRKCILSSQLSFNSKKVSDNTFQRIGAGQECTQKRWMPKIREYEIPTLPSSSRNEGNTNETFFRLEILKSKTNHTYPHLVPEEQHARNTHSLPPRAMNFGEFVEGKAQQPLPPVLQSHEADIDQFSTYCHDLIVKILTLFAIGLKVRFSFRQPPMLLYHSSSQL